jgi:hypothetical protein
MRFIEATNGTTLVSLDEPEWDQLAMLKKLEEKTDRPVKSIQILSPTLWEVRFYGESTARQVQSI